MSAAVAVEVLHRPLLNGQWVDGGVPTPVVSPWTGQPCAHTVEATPEQARAAADAAVAVFPRLRSLTLHARSEGLRTIARGIENRAEEFARTICSEVGKPLGLARIEVQRAARTFLIAAEEALRPPGEVVYPGREPQGAGAVGRIQYFPLGPVLGIVPFNFPLNLAVHKVAPALAAGCPVVIKPPPQGPGAARLLGEVFLESGLPPAALQVLPGGRAVGEALTACEQFAVISFTGSAAAGWGIRARVRPRQRVLLELGGNAPVIVDESADLDAAARAVATGGYVYSGQLCISTQRVYVHSAVADRFEQRLAEQILTNVPVSGDPREEKTLVGPLIDDASATRVDTWVKESIATGARTLIEGERRGERIVSPWLLEDVPDAARLHCEEVFGPVVALWRVGDFREALARANGTRYGLQAAVFTDSLKHAELAYQELEFGSVLVNLPTAFRIDAVAYGGVKESGVGREGVKEAVREFSEPRLLVAKP